MRIVGAILLAAGVGLFGFEVIAHESRDALVLYGSLFLAAAGVALLGYADEIAAGLKQLLAAVSGLFPRNRSGE